MSPNLQCGRRQSHGSALDRNLSDNLNRTNTETKQERQTSPHKDDE